MAAGLAPFGRLLLLHQVHGIQVHTAPWQDSRDGDAAVCDAAGWILGIETADCLPLLLVDPHRRAVAAVHAGWRGTAAGIARHAVAALQALGSAPGDLLAAVGPGIGPCCYEIGSEVEAAFGRESEGFFRAGPRGRPHLDLRTANTHQLLETGLPAARILHVDECTFCHPDLYHSFRREGRGGGRMINFIGLR